jgi:hypothetical protein
MRPSIPSTLRIPRRWEKLLKHRRCEHFSDIKGTRLGEGEVTIAIAFLYLTIQIKN